MKLALLALLLATVVAGAAPAKRAGDLPPSLVWDKLKGDCPASLEWASLLGNVVVISIRDTLPEIADWKQLTEKFHGQPAIFLFVFSGSEFLLDQELQHNSYPGCVLFDERHSNERNLASTRYADSTVVVDDHGFIAGWAFGDVEAGVASLLRHEPPADFFATAEGPSSHVAPTTPRKKPEPSLVVNIALATADEQPNLESDFGHGYFAATKSVLRSIILFLWEMPTARISFPETLDERNYDVVANLPLNDRELARTLVQDAIKSHFGLAVEKQTRTVRGYVLTSEQSSTPHLQASKQGSISAGVGGEGMMSGTALDMEDVVRDFEDILEAPVIDQTGLKGKYDYFASSKLNGPEAAFDMANQLGLVLTKTERPVEMLIITGQQFNLK
jgi:uncharacterized protein (TIGR03435 family)